MEKLGSLFKIAKLGSQRQVWDLNPSCLAPESSAIVIFCVVSLKERKKEAQFSLPGTLEQEGWK